MAVGITASKCALRSACWATARSGALTWVLAYSFSKIMEESLRQDFTLDLMLSTRFCFT
jgi:hypothetical protein